MESKEIRLISLPGAVMFFVNLAVFAAGLYLFSQEGNGPLWGTLVVVVGFFLLFGNYLVQPNQAVVATLFGRYVGTNRVNGWYWTNPFTSRKSISLRIRNFNSEKLKVNDLHGNPIEIAAVIVWRVVDSAKASFDVESYKDFVAIQSETALRHLAARYPYDDHDTSGLSLRGNADEVVQTLRDELQARLTAAGVEILEARLSHLAYAPEIAHAMLQRQQASAILAARQIIVEGAVGMVQMALTKLSDEHIVELDEERKAQMVSNLLVVLTSERSTQPVINAGSLY
ncbi:SPFH domain-containing protein [Deinococcus cellulosilyticus]|uniref:Membrane protein n=1 Tax=Deinococcus cellulosilyticus (strain DSM 18568 / NBRC 106333 / KACC 11606 / 5516J-15) TaxID=1223518 RepID=A0A511N3K3_DEIC1|nr:SPFH domain-containing protein [Deinococcus cellulosilyticus]GEM47450.1 membrane protein [Deinococcus cellulosilyticus NBRC 106333 = KACC 11606]